MRLFFNDASQIKIVESQSQFSLDSGINVSLRSNTSCLEAHNGFFRLLIEGIIDPYLHTACTVILGTP